MRKYTVFYGFSVRVYGSEQIKAENREEAVKKAMSTKLCFESCNDIAWDGADQHTILYIEDSQGRTFAEDLEIPVTAE